MSRQLPSHWKQWNSFSLEFELRCSDLRARWNAYLRLVEAFWKLRASHGTKIGHSLGCNGFKITISSNTGRRDSKSSSHFRNSMQLTKRKDLRHCRNGSPVILLLRLDMAASSVSCVYNGLNFKWNPFCTSALSNLWLNPAECSVSVSNSGNLQKKKTLFKYRSRFVAAWMNVLCSGAKIVYPSSKKRIIVIESKFDASVIVATSLISL